MHTARERDLDLPILESVLASNEMHVRSDLRARCTANGRRRIGLFGLSFKSGTDDLRESPLVELAER